MFRGALVGKVRPSLRVAKNPLVSPVQSKTLFGITSLHGKREAKRVQCRGPATVLRVIWALPADPRTRPSTRHHRPSASSPG
jgi:hypothetical protein